ncbi:MAG: NifB/NifX family molybdenum-iron cluster-binding protein [Desulfobacteraceae bacterium]|jgi:predicted Fe-Mo cluster-binding NifX family protein|nr:NifB/NifX family molybdenum-iron cluster-binding protein [Desulfobacteraceae bacterium]MBT4365133.1 NifB/NifX family molybdenum-iron cluster-binding protein [Desulfobacteraceae bacterium]
MKVAISSTGMDLDSPVDPRFGRCAFFIIVETEDMSFEAFSNENINLSGGAGIQSGTFVASKGIKAVLTGRCGPKAMKTLVAAKIEVFTGLAGKVREVVENFKKGGLTSTTEANASGKSGVSGTGMMGGGRGMGGGGRGIGGGGRGMGGGRQGMGMGPDSQPKDIKTTDILSKEEELKFLKEQAAELKKQMNDIESKIRDL